MLKRLTIFTLVTAMLLNLFSAPVSMLIYEVNQQVQAYGNSPFEEISITICETTCTIQEKLAFQTREPIQAKRPLKVSFNPMALYLHPAEVWDASTGCAVDPPWNPVNNDFFTQDVNQSVFVPPQRLV